MRHKTTNWRISRRTMLRGIGAAVALPLLDVMEPYHASGAAVPTVTTRIAYLYIPNGVADGAWGAKEIGHNGRLEKLNKWMSPFESFKDDIIIPRNMWTPRGNGHGAGTATWLTGNGFDGRRLDVGGTSADQIAARHLSEATLLPSIELSVRGEGFFSGSLKRNSISWSDGRTPMPRDTEPRVVFDRMFRVGTSGASDRSLLDAVLEDARSMRRRVSVADQRKIDEYLRVGAIRSYGLPISESLDNMFENAPTITTHPSENRFRQIARWLPPAVGATTSAYSTCSLACDI